jgi:hypothetical protein
MAGSFVNGDEARIAGGGGRGVVRRPSRHGAARDLYTLIADHFRRAKFGVK